MAKSLARQLGLKPKSKTPKCWACGQAKGKRKGAKRASTAKGVAVKTSKGGGPISQWSTKRYVRWLSS